MSMQALLSRMLIVNALLFASAAVICLVLAVVCLIFSFYQDEITIADSFSTLIRHTLIFMGLTLATGGGFWATLKYRLKPRPASLWWLSQGTMAIAVVAATLHYLPN